MGHPTIVAQTGAWSERAGGARVTRRNQCGLLRATIRTPSVCPVSPPNLTWTPDVLPGFERTVLPMPRAWDGEVDAVVVRRTGGEVPTGAAVL